MSDDDPRGARPGGVPVAVLLFVGSALLTLAFLLVFEGDVFDATTRTLVSAEWLKAPHNIIGTQLWGDGNYLLPAVGIALGGDLFYSVRILYALVGAATIPVLFWLAKALFDRHAALLAALLFALNPYRIAFSLQGASGEIPFLFLLFLSLLVTVKQRPQPSGTGAACAGLLFTLATSFRFEGGFWAAFGCLLLLTPPGCRFRPSFEKSRVIPALVFCLVAASYPALLATRWWQVYGDPILYFRNAALNQGQFYANGQNPNWSNAVYVPFEASFWVLSTVAILTPLVAVPGFVGLVRALRRHPTSALVAAAVLLNLALFSIASVRSHFPLEYRYALAVDGLVCIFVPYGWQWLGSRFALLDRPRFQVAATCTSVLLFFGAYTVAAFADKGVIGRRLGMLSPIRPGQYETRTFLDWFASAMPGRKALLSPCVRGPYAILRRRDLIQEGRLRWFSDYSDHKDGIFVYDRRGYEAGFEAAARDYDVLVFSRICTGIGLVDGRIDDPFLPPTGAAQWSRGSLTLRHLRDVGSLAVYAVQ
jgi:4-amino-4-deoxy-L-arabinose transferase-like glycosyltransferase